MKRTPTSANKHLSRDEITYLVKYPQQSKEHNKAMQHLQHCAFCNEAYNGISQLPDFTTLQTLNKLWKFKSVKKHSPKLTVNLNSVYVVLTFLGLIALVIVYFFFFL